MDKRACVQTQEHSPSIRFTFHRTNTGYFANIEWIFEETCVTSRRLNVHLFYQ